MCAHAVSGMQQINLSLGRKGLKFYLWEQDWAQVQQ